MNTVAKQQKGNNFGVNAMKKDNPFYESDEDETFNESTGSFFGFHKPAHLSHDRPKPPVRQPSMEVTQKIPVVSRTPPSREPSLDGVGALQQMWQKYDRICESLSSMSSWGSGNSSGSSVTTRDSWGESGGQDSPLDICPLPGDSFSSSQAPPGVRGVRRATSCSLTPVREPSKGISSVFSRKTPSQRNVRRGVSAGAVPSLLGSALGPFKNPFGRTVTPLRQNSFTNQGAPARLPSFANQGTPQQRDPFAQPMSIARQFSFNGSQHTPGQLTRQGSLKRSGSFSKRKALKKQGSLTRQNSFNLQQNSLNMQKFFSDYDKITTPDIAKENGRPRPSVTGW